MEIPLSELTPIWHQKAGEKVGVVFSCPACPPDEDGKRICMIHVQWSHPWRANQCLWQKSGESFSDLTLSPSIDGTAGGCKFHGWIQDGVVRW